MKKLLSGVIFFWVSVMALAAPKYVFMFIGDGLGASQRQMAEYFVQQDKGDDYKLTMNKMPVAGLNTTHSVNNLVTDSGAAGTALATGEKTNNGMIAVLPNGIELKSTLDYAQEAGKAIGVISTTRITHATPAAYVAKNISRGNENEIAEDFSKSNVDFIAGGGYRHFVSSSTTGSKREDGSLLTEMRNNGYKTFIGETSSKDFINYKPSKNEKVFAALTLSHLPYEVDRMNTQKDQPSLADITNKGIEVLQARDKDGFFMVVEGGRIDHASHANDVAGTIYDTLAFDKSIEVAMEFYDKHKEDTLIVVAGDHETGGLGMGYGSGKPLDLDVIKNVKVSINGTLEKMYTGDRQKYMKFLETNLGLNNLTSDERSRMISAMDAEDKNVDNESLYGGYNPTAIAASHILNERAGVGFTTFDHTGSQIPLSAIGQGSEAFGGFKDNTEIGKEMIKLYN
ncbi:alkaline phosphatase [Psychrilyobacter atlanticus]|uniref:alkaline phosphatase n=1 Tax=Psychrilyobacter atlanticus TaxID=271091 RepID=UPI000421944C|nr:alkaline phosphatase [Psychrilyobacter atlanticus]